MNRAFRLTRMRLLFGAIAVAGTLVGLLTWSVMSNAEIARQAIITQRDARAASDRRIDALTQQSNDLVAEVEALRKQVVSLGAEPVVSAPAPQPIPVTTTVPPRRSSTTTTRLTATTTTRPPSTTTTTKPAPPTTTTTAPCTTIPTGRCLP